MEVLIRTMTEAELEAVLERAVTRALEQASGAGEKPAPAGPPPREWLSTREAAAYARRSTDTVLDWIKAEKVTARFVGGSRGYEISRASLNAHLKL